ncbi:MAG TPA: argininosuccinate lyase [Jatrophihabitans sp.]|nr:argininosuccinate lyase [Jatrophihabitans sp.]
MARLTAEVGIRTRRILYGEPTPAELSAELDQISLIDQAHLLMLADCGLIPRAAAAELLAGIADLRAAGFAPLVGRPASRGLYLMYEGYLISRLGPEIGGVLHTARSRNDLKATGTALRLRDWTLGFLEQAARLQAALLSRARRYAEVLMPVYTHYQAAMPISYGYYLLGVAEALGRDLDAVRHAAAGLRACPLGAGAVAGTDLPIDPARTARLLGFTGSCTHALDAVASRDVALRLLAAAAGLTGTLSRLAADLQLWSTAEFGFLRFPDRLVGGSSAMPQKRNAFLLEHVRAKPAVAIGAWAGAAAAMSATPFTNSIEVGTEAIALVWPGLAACEQSVLLCQPLVSAAVPDARRMAERAEAGFTNATAVANELVRQGVPFRVAHEQVGDAVRQAVADGRTDLTGFASSPAVAGLTAAGLTAAGALIHQAHGGGPAAFAGIWQSAYQRWLAYGDWLRSWRGELAGAADRLAAEVTALIESRDTAAESHHATPEHGHVAAESRDAAAESHDVTPARAHDVAAVPAGGGVA